MKTLYRCTKCAKVFGADRQEATYRLDCPFCDNVMETPVSLEEEVALQKQGEGVDPPACFFSSQATAHRRFTRSVVAIIIIGALGLLALYFVILMLDQMTGMVE